MLLKKASGLNGSGLVSGTIERGSAPSKAAAATTGQTAVGRVGARLLAAAANAAIAATSYSPAVASVINVQRWNRP